MARPLERWAPRSGNRPPRHRVMTLLSILTGSRTAARRTSVSARGRVKAPLVPGTALQKAPQRQPKAPKKPPFPKREQRVLGTGGIETTAVAQERRDKALVAPDQKHGQGNGDALPPGTLLSVSPLSGHDAGRARPSPPPPSPRPEAPAASAPSSCRARPRRPRRRAPGP